MGELMARSVIALEENADLARFGRSALVEHGIASVTYVEAPLQAGHRQRAPYDVILFGGGVAEIYSELLPAVRYVTSHQEAYDADPNIYGDFADLAAELDGLCQERTADRE